MPETDSYLTLGFPRFSDAHPVQLANTRGTLAAWREAVAKGAGKAAVGVTGDFAVGLRLPGGRSFLAVDRFAIRTLCYRVDNGQLRFAARADELADAGTEIDPQAIFDYLYFHVIPSPRTIYKGIGYQVLTNSATHHLTRSKTSSGNCCAMR
jgi:asparagine synthase (glutamine-hydrolysing)